jgi:hypothetical protein
MLKDLLPVPDPTPEASQQSNRQRRRASYMHGKSHRGRSWLADKKKKRSRELAPSSRQSISEISHFLLPLRIPESTRSYKLLGILRLVA